jgi:hypothetical protein
LQQGLLIVVAQIHAVDRIAGVRLIKRLVEATDNVDRITAF